VLQFCRARGGRRQRHEVQDQEEGDGKKKEKDEEESVLSQKYEGDSV